MKKLIIVTFCFLTITIFGEVVSDGVKEEEQIEESVEEIEEIVESKSYEELLLSNKKIGKIEKLDITEKKIELRGVYYRKIRIDRVYVDLEREISEVIILRKDLEDGFKRKNRDVKTIKLEITKGAMVGKGKVDLPMVGKSNVYLSGNFKLDKNQNIEYRIKKATVKTVIPVPKSILKKFSEKLNPIFKLDDLGIPMYSSEIIYEKNRIVIR